MRRRLFLGSTLRQQHGFDAISMMLTNLYSPRDNYHPRKQPCFAGPDRRSMRRRSVARAE